jgi:hypothetical protein
MLAILPYRLEEFGGFRLLRADPLGIATLTFGPNDTTLPVEQPYFTVMPAFNEVPPPAERESFARRVLVASMNGPVPRIVSSQSIRVGGTQMHETIAESEDGVTKDPLMVVQWLRFGSGVVQMFGIARRDQWDAALPRMRALRDGFGSK